MKRSFKNISKLLFITGCVSVIAYSITTANAAPLVYDVDNTTGTSSYGTYNQQPQVRTNYSSPNRIRLEGDVAFNDNGQKINLSLRNTDVQQVLRMFADKAGLNIVFHESVAGNVTLDLVDVSLADAFKMVMKMSNLTYVIKDNTIMVVALDQAEKLNLTKDNVNILPVKYVDAAYMAHFLNQNIFSMNAPGLSYGPIVTTNSETNELLIFGSDSDYNMAKKIVDRFDKRPKMTTYRVNHTTPYEMAKMICETLFQLAAEGNSTSQGSTKFEMKSEFELGSEPSETKEGTLGGGTIACTVKSGVTTDNVSSYQARPSITIYVQQELGTITMVGGTEQQVQMVNDFIMDNDRKQPQALLEIMIVSLTESGSKEFNNQWSVQAGNTGWEATTGITGTIMYHGSLGRQGSAISQQISYLVSNSKGKILSNPKIIITNGKTATIDLTQDYVESTTVQVLTGSTSSSNVVQRTYETADDNGIKVEITPFISPDGYVSLTLKPEYASVLDYITDQYIEDGMTAPVAYTAATLLQRRNLDLSNVRIKDGETLLIGGMLQDEQSVSTNKIPILGDLPIIGFFFRSTTKSNGKTELLFLITPHIIKDTEDIAEL